MRDIRKAIEELHISENSRRNYGDESGFTVKVLSNLLDPETIDNLVKLVEEAIEDDRWHREVGSE